MRLTLRLGFELFSSLQKYIIPNKLFLTSEAVQDKLLALNLVKLPKTMFVFSLYKSLKVYSRMVTKYNTHFDMKVMVKQSLKGLHRPLGFQEG